ncbi:DegV family protein [Phocea massiliensis]|uniref:DegV family protein n=1 Tax=Merdimmobilis hominis TaxID=2897707 RepID=A0A938X5J6_9FIRM|nr:DegV family protein [Merdimmobilis hominis]MBM6919919.1 DegV family protein [Merdimmobilis hominis]
MREFVILTDVTCDLPQSYYEKNNIPVVPFMYTIDDVDYDGTFEHSLNPHLFYEKLKSGSMAKTAAVPPDTLCRFFEHALKAGKDVVYLGFSSGLSSTYQNACIARDEILPAYDGAVIRCVDSLCASMGQGLFVDLVLRKAGEPDIDANALADYAESVKQNVCHYFTVDDLHHLYRGGRVSKTAAIFGTMLGIKPVLHVDEEGHLIPIGKVRGRKASLDALVAKMGTKIEGQENPYVFISHGDCEKDAEYVAKQVKDKYGIKTKIINPIGPVIGTHSGPGTVALFFVGNDRSEKKL